jgi:hypothetical protein
VQCGIPDQILEQRSNFNGKTGKVLTVCRLTCIIPSYYAKAIFLVLITVLRFYKTLYRKRVCRNPLYYFFQLSESKIASNKINIIKKSNILTVGSPV